MRRGLTSLPNAQGNPSSALANTAHSTCSPPPRIGCPRVPCWEHACEAPGMPDAEDTGWPGHQAGASCPRNGARVPLAARADKLPPYEKLRSFHELLPCRRGTTRTRGPAAGSSIATLRVYRPGKRACLLDRCSSVSCEVGLSSRPSHKRGVVPLARGGQAYASSSTRLAFFTVCPSSAPPARSEPEPGQ